jgi:hypothetical protein
MRRSVVLLSAIAAFGLAPMTAAFADNPPGPPGPPSQSCEDLAPSSPGHAADARGAAFNEEGGISGQHYSESSQYDVACFQWAQHH